ncbi:MAG TPA: tetratricopeptide repeat protein, partial [Bacteroidia bacterium]|nr:tetratricopeptide repeat protein [Bacteroidia bacterium]
MPFKTTLYQILLPALLLSSVTVGAQTDIVQQGWDLERTGRFKEAYDVFVKAINQYPDSSRAWKGKADMELKVMGDTLAALKDYDRAIELKPKAVWAFFARGQIKYRRKEYTAALDDFNKAIDLKQDNWEFYSYRGVSKSFLKDYEGAIKDYTMAIHLGHRDASLYYDRANEYCWLKQFDKAMADCDTAIEINHSYSAAKDLKQRAQNAKSGKGNFTDNSNLIVNMNLVAASSESTVDTGQVFKVAYSIHVNGTDLKSISLSGIKPPSFNGLIIIAGPNQHTTPRFVKGGIIDSVSYDYVLEANGGGSIIIDAASIDVQGKTYTSSP